MEKCNFIMHSSRWDVSQFYNFTCTKAHIAKYFSKLILKGNLAQTHKNRSWFRDIFVFAIVRLYRAHFLIFPGVGLTKSSRYHGFYAL